MWLCCNKTWRHRLEPQYWAIKMGVSPPMLAVSLAFMWLVFATPMSSSPCRGRGLRLTASWWQVWTLWELVPSAKRACRQGFTLTISFGHGGSLVLCPFWIPSFQSKSWGWTQFTSRTSPILSQISPVRWPSLAEQIPHGFSAGSARSGPYRWRLPQWSSCSWSHRLPGWTSPGRHRTMEACRPIWARYGPGGPGQSAAMFFGLNVTHQKWWILVNEKMEKPGEVAKKKHQSIWNWSKMEIFTKEHGGVSKTKRKVYWTTRNGE